MSGYTIITFPSDSSNQDVKIAGNFTNWQPEALKFNSLNKRFEYKVDKLVDGASSGKYSFKFIVNGGWIADQNYSSEFDGSGNENNVILYDYTSDKSASNEHNSKIKDQVSSENKLEPHTPDPSPYNLSATTTNVPPTPVSTSAPSSSNGTSDTDSGLTPAAAAAGVTPVAGPTIIPVLGTPRTEEPPKLSATEEESTTASKAVPKTNLSEEPPTNGSSEFIPLTETVKNPGTSSIPVPEPVGRPEQPTKTKEPSELSSSGNKSTLDPKIVGDEPSKPKPVSRPIPPTTTQAPVNPSPLSNEYPVIADSKVTETVSKEASNGKYGSSDPSDETRTHTQLTHGAQSQPPTSGQELPEYSLGFFATILHVITQFFRRWFGE